jgi:hypothetical protein
MPKWTPGPWARYGDFIEAKDGLEQQIVADLIHCDVGKTPEDEITANANLITAAPELYEALEAICDSAEDGRNVPEWPQGRLVAARAALAKARGEGMPTTAIEADPTLKDSTVPNQGEIEP